MPSSRYECEVLEHTFLKMLNSRKEIRYGCFIRKNACPLSPELPCFLFINYTQMRTMPASKVCQRLCPSSVLDITTLFLHVASALQSFSWSERGEERHDIYSFFSFYSILPYAVSPFPSSFHDEGKGTFPGLLINDISRMQYCHQLSVMTDDCLSVCQKILTGMNPIKIGYQTLTIFPVSLLIFHPKILKEFIAF